MFRYPLLRSKPQRWIPELRFGYPPLRNFQNRSGNYSQKFGVVSAPTLHKNPAVMFFSVTARVACKVRISNGRQALSRPFLFSPPLESSVPICSQAKHRENDNSTPFAPYTVGSFGHQGSVNSGFPTVV